MISNTATDADGPELTDLIYPFFSKHDSVSYTIDEVFDMNLAVEPGQSKDILLVGFPHM